MTLIFGFYSKRSIVITADGRCVEHKETGEKTIAADNSQKIFPVQDLPIAIVHHGERRIDNRDIKDIVEEFILNNLDYIRLNPLREIADKLKQYIDLDVKVRLNDLRWLDTAVGLWVVGFSPKSNQPEIYEIFWKYPNDASITKFNGDLNRAGDARKYIEWYFEKPFPIGRYSLDGIKRAGADYLAGYQLELYKIAEEKQKRSGESIFGGHKHQLAIKSSGWKWKISPPPVEQALFEQFKAKRELWIECLSGKDRNSIFNQIFKMVWNAAVFKVINEARKITPVNEEGQREINGMLHHFMDECFFDSQLLAIRRLTDRAYPLQDIKRGIFSLSALLNDIRENIILMTRENLFKTEGLEYDYEAISKRELEYGLEQSKSRQAYWVPHELDSWRVKSRHEEIDALSGVNEDQRKPSDIIRANVLDYLIKILEDASVDIKLYVDKHIAHLATPQSREYDKVDEVSITLDHLWNAHKIICQVANFIDACIVSVTGHDFLPVPQFNQFEFIDKPLVSYSNIEVLSKAWDDFSKETHSWSFWGVKELREQSGL